MQFEMDIILLIWKKTGNWVLTVLVSYRFSLNKWSLGSRSKLFSLALSWQIWLFFLCVWLCVEKGVFHKGSGDSSFAEVLPCETACSWLARCFSTIHLTTDILKSKGKRKTTILFNYWSNLEKVKHYNLKCISEHVLVSVGRSMKALRRTNKHEQITSSIFF